jgi:hypothetical protein
MGSGEAFLGLGLFIAQICPVPIRLDLACRTAGELELFWAQAEARLLFTQSSRIT